MAFIRRIRRFFSTPSKRIGAGMLVVFGVIGGIAFAVVYDAAYSYTNSTEFCVSCHSLQWASLSLQH